jgi:hypothetical protein
MQFFQMNYGEARNWYNYLIIPMETGEFWALKERFETQIPKLGSTVVVRGGKPFIVFEYGGAIDLSEQFGSGDTLGDKLNAGDIITVILTDHNQPFTPSETGVKINLNIDHIIAYPLTYTKEMERTYEFYVHYNNLKGGNRQLKIKSKSKRLSFR